MLHRHNSYNVLTENNTKFFFFVKEVARAFCNHEEGGRERETAQIFDHFENIYKKLYIELLTSKHL